MFAQSYGQLLVARAVVGLGEAGYGSVGAAMVATHFPQRMRGGLLGGFFASASVGSVLGVVLGGVIAARFGWQAAFGVVGIPGLFFALIYLFVRDYQHGRSRRGHCPDRAVANTRRDGSFDPWVADGALGLRRRGRASDRAVCAMVVAAKFSQSLLRNRARQSRDPSRIRGARRGSRQPCARHCRRSRRCSRPGGKFIVVAILSLLSMVTLMLAFGGGHIGLSPDASEPVSPDPARRLPCNLHGWPGRGHRDRRHSPRRPIDRRVDTVARAEPVRSRGWTVHRGVVVRCDRAGERARADTACLHHRGGGVRGGAERLPGR